MADAAGSIEKRGYCEEFEKGLNQAAMARMRSMDRRGAASQHGNGSGGAPVSTDEFTDASEPVSAVVEPVKQIGSSIGEVSFSDLCDRSAHRLLLFVYVHCMSNPSRVI